MLFISGKEDKISWWDSQCNQMTISDDQIEVEFTSNKWLQIHKKETAALEKPPLTTSRWHQFMETVQPHEVQVVRMKEVNIGYCCEDVFHFIFQCSNMIRLLLYDIQDNKSGKDLVTGLTRALPRLKKLKNIQIWDVNMGKEGSKVISVINSPDLRILFFHRTGLSEAESSLTSALHRFPRLSYLDLFNSGLTKDESLSVLNILPSSCPNIVHLSIAQPKFTSEETMPLCKLKKLICLQISFETIEDWLRALGKFPQPLEMIYMYDNPSMGNEFKTFIAIISSCTKLRYLGVNNDVLNCEEEDKVSKVMTRKRGRLVVWPKDSQGWKEYQDQITKLKYDCMSS